MAASPLLSVLARVVTCLVTFVKSPNFRVFVLQYTMWTVFMAEYFSVVMQQRVWGLFAGVVMSAFVLMNVLTVQRDMFLLEWHALPTRATLAAKVKLLVSHLFPVAVSVVKVAWLLHAVPATLEMWFLHFVFFELRLACLLPVFQLGVAYSLVHNFRVHPDAAKFVNELLDIVIGDSKGDKAQ